MHKVAADINAKQGEGNAIGVQVDAADEPSVEALAKATDTVFGRADVLVYSAGTAKASPIWDFNLNDFDLSVKVNLTGYFLTAKHFSLNDS